MHITVFNKHKAKENNVGRKKLTEPKLIRSVYMPKKTWEMVDIIAGQNGFKSRNEFIEKAIIHAIQRDATNNREDHV